MRRLHVDDQELAEMHDLGSTQADGVEFGAEGEAPRAPQRTEWPELVATEAGRARDAILNERPELLCVSRACPHVRGLGCASLRLQGCGLDGCGRVCPVRRAACVACAVGSAPFFQHPGLTRPDVCMCRVQTVDTDAMVTMDFRNDRVRLFVDADNVVVRTPRVG